MTKKTTVGEDWWLEGLGRGGTEPQRTAGRK